MSDFAHMAALRMVGYLREYKRLLGDGEGEPYDCEYIATLIKKREADHTKAIAAAVAAERARCVAACRSVVNRKGHRRDDADVCHGATLCLIEIERVPHG